MNFRRIVEKLYVHLVNMQEQLRKIANTYRHEIWVPHQLSELRTKIFIDQFALYCYPDFVEIYFLPESLPMAKNGFSMIT